MTIRIDRSLYIVFTLFFLIFLTSSFIVTNNVISSAITIFLWTILLFVQLIYYNKSFNSFSLLLSIILIICVWITTLVRDEPVRNSILVTYSFMLAIIIANNISWDEFTDGYTKLMAYLCGISLFLFFLFLLIPQLNNLFLVENNAGHLFTNLIVYIDSQSYMRNMGMFWEPGAFQTFICLALLFELFSDNISAHRIILFVITIITTFSTTGFIALFLIMILFFQNRKSNTNKIKLLLFTLLLSLIVFSLFNLDLFFNKNTSTVFGKLINYYENNWNSSPEHLSSVTIRYNSVIKPLMAFFKHPITGWGYQGLIEELYHYTHGMNTCTFVNWFAVYGLVYGSIMLFGYTSFASLLANNWYERLSIISILFFITISENYVDNSFFVLLAIYGLNNQTISNRSRNHSGETLV